jgi:hypothetical protein
MRRRFECFAAMFVVVFLLAGCAGTNKTESDTNTSQNAVSKPAEATKHVKGIDGWEGDIVGTPAKRSAFTKLKIGMSLKQVTDLVGEPTDRGEYLTGKQFIPFYYGSDMHRTELVYKNLGRLVFAGGSAFGDYAAYNLISITHNAHEGAYR